MKGWMGLSQVLALCILARTGIGETSRSMNRTNLMLDNHTEVTKGLNETAPVRESGSNMKLSLRKDVQTSTSERLLPTTPSTDEPEVVVERRKTKKKGKLHRKRKHRNKAPPKNELRGWKRKDVRKHRNWKLMDHNHCGFSHTDRIIGGKDASLGAYPWIARLGYINSNIAVPLFRCGAVLISKLYIVTAAHCVTGLPLSFEVGVVRLGEYNLIGDPDCEGDVCADPVMDYKPANISVHEEYGRPLFKHDIAIIRLQKKVTFTSFISPICMISGPQLDMNYVGSITEVAGWGIYDIDDPKPSVRLQMIKMPVVNLERCIQSFKKHAEVGSTQMCVGGEIGADSCGGDSGGPLMHVESTDGRPPRYFFIGIVSFGTKRCGATPLPGVYTRLGEYVPWILDNMQK